MAKDWSNKSNGWKLTKMAKYYGQNRPISQKSQKKTAKNDDNLVKKCLKIGLNSKQKWDFKTQGLGNGLWNKMWDGNLIILRASPCERKSR